MWESTALEVLRVLINDLDGTTYQDCRLIKILQVSAMQVLREITFTTPYVISFADFSVSPDPSSDSNFILLVSMKAACIIAQGEMKTESGCAVRVTDGPSSIDLGSKLDGLKSNLRTSCDAYEIAKRDYVSGNIIGHAIFGPYSPGDRMINYQGYVN